MCSGSEAGSYVRLIDFVYHSTLGVRVIKKKKTDLVVELAGDWVDQVLSEVRLPVFDALRSGFGVEGLGFGV